MRGGAIYFVIKLGKRAFLRQPTVAVHEIRMENVCLYTCKCEYIYLGYMCAHIYFERKHACVCVYLQSGGDKISQEM